MATNRESCVGRIDRFSRAELRRALGASVQPIGNKTKLITKFLVRRNYGERFRERCSRPVNLVELILIRPSRRPNNISLGLTHARSHESTDRASASDRAVQQRRKQHASSGRDDDVITTREQKRPFPREAPRRVPSSPRAAASRHRRRQ